jgi:hypothetical protein
MLGGRNRGQLEFIVRGPLRDLVPDDHILARVDGGSTFGGCAARWTISMQTGSADRASTPKQRCG